MQTERVDPFVKIRKVDRRSVCSEDTDDTSTTGRILKVAKSGGTPTVLAENQDSPISIAVDATSVYWACADEGTIKKIAK